MDDSADGQYYGGNSLIDGLPQADRDAVFPHLTMMTAEETSSGISRGEPITAAYFPVDAVFSVLVEFASGDCYEADTVGREGLLGGELVLGADVASRSVICQVGGRFAQIPAGAFERCLSENAVISGRCAASVADAMVSRAAIDRVQLRPHAIGTLRSMDVAHARRDRAAGFPAPRGIFGDDARRANGRRRGADEGAGSDRCDPLCRWRRERYLRAQAAPSSLRMLRGARGLLEATRNRRIDGARG